MVKTIYIYAKTNMDVSVFDDIISQIYIDNDYEIEFVLENKRSFRNYDILLQKFNSNDILIINELSDMGLNQIDLINRLDYIINNNIILFINTYPTTYESHINLTMNKIVLSTIKQSLLSGNTDIIIKKSSVGRPKMDFPDKWDELYESWVKHDITSKEFMNALNLKKATFYNLLAEYKYIQELNDEYINKYRLA